MTCGENGERPGMSAALRGLLASIVAALRRLLASIVVDLRRLLAPIVVALLVAITACIVIAAAMSVLTFGAIYTTTSSSVVRGQADGDRYAEGRGRIIGGLDCVDTDDVTSIYACWVREAFWGFRGSSWKKVAKDAVPTAWRLLCVMLTAGVVAAIGLSLARGDGGPSVRRSLIVGLSCVPLFGIVALVDDLEMKLLWLPWLQSDDALYELVYEWTPIVKKWLGFVLVGLLDGLLADVIITTSISYQQNITAQYIGEAAQMGGRLTRWRYTGREAVVHIAFLLRGRIVILLSQIVVFERLFEPGERGLGNRMIQIIRSGSLSEHGTVEPWFALILVLFAWLVVGFRVLSWGALLAFVPKQRERLRRTWLQPRQSIVARTVGLLRLL